MGPRFRAALKRRLRPFIEQVALEQLYLPDGRLLPRVEDALFGSPVLADKRIPIDRDAADYVLPVSPPYEGPVRGAQDFPLPPQELWTVPGRYLELAAWQMDQIFGCLRDAGMAMSDVDSVLEFGCGTGRLLRYFAEHAVDHDVWGVDIHSERVAWAQAHLSPPLSFSSCSTAPHLPFEDRFFSLVYAGSVFTHISELADAWFLELLRVTRPGGYLFLSIQDQAYISSIRARGVDDWISDVISESASQLDRLGVDHSAVVIDRGPVAMVFHDRASLVKAWGQHADVLSVTDEAFESQSAVVLRKRKLVPPR